MLKYILPSLLALAVTACAASADDGPAAFHQRWAERAFAAAVAPNPQPANRALPFSFVYGGRPSAALLDQWKCNVEEKTLDATRRLRCLTLTDPATGLEVRAEATVYTDTPGVDWTLRFTNRGDKDAPLLEQVRAVDVRVAAGVQGPLTLHRLAGSPCRVDDWAPREDPLAPGQAIEFAPVGGRSSNAACPFFNLQWKGGGVITAIGWSGQWSARVAHAGGAATIQAGMQNMRLKLHPGESIRSPRILQLYWSGDDPFEGYNLFRRTMLAHVVPRIDGRPATPPIAHLSTSFYELNGSTEANVFSHLDSIRGLGFEVFWLDAYWTKGGFPEGMGNYGFPLERVEPRDRFPRGLKAVGEAVHAARIGYLMWFEPERVHGGTYIAREHPEWVISPSGDGSGHLNLGNPDARKHITEYLIAAVKEYRLAWLRIDYNIDPLGFWQLMDKKDPDRLGMAEIRYIEGLYRLWDDVRAAHPGLLIDNCASGGRRIDLETCSRSIPLWRSDNTCDMLDHKPATVQLAAIKNQLMTAGLSRYVPFSVSGQMGSSPYLFRSGSNAGIAFCEDCRPQEYPRETLRRAIEEAKRLRPYYSGDFYVLGEPTARPDDWCVLQYHRPRQSDGMVLAFRRHGSPHEEIACRLRGIDPAASYEVTISYGYDRPPPARMPGSELGKLPIRIRDCPGSVVVEYKKAS
jgi:alpha-galactosidase